MLNRTLILAGILIAITGNLFAQTCCSGGVPIAANIGLPSGEKGNIQFSLNYDLNTLVTLKEGTNTLDDRIRERHTQSVLLGVSYSVNNRFSIDGFFSYVNQIRTINFPGFPQDQIKTNGLGDMVFLAKYILTKPSATSTQVTIGLGAKLPTGASDLTRNGITLNADVQPGSGALDAIFWGNLIKNIPARRSMNFLSTITYRATGENDSYFGTQVYELGNELQIRAGISDRLNLGNLVFDPSLSLRYRHVVRDINDGSELVNTGGKWVFVIPAISYLIKENLSANITVELPLYANVDGTQLSPTSRFNAGLFFKINTSSKENQLDQLDLTRFMQ